MQTFMQSVSVAQEVCREEGGALLLVSTSITAGEDYFGISKDSLSRAPLTPSTLHAGQVRAHA